MESDLVRSIARGSMLYSFVYMDIGLLTDRIFINFLVSGKSVSVYGRDGIGTIRVLHLRALEAVDLLEIFLSMNPNTSGYVEFHGFLRALRLKPCGLSEKLFGFIDVQKTGKITFKQFLVGSAHILKQPLFRHACDLAFNECDMNRKNNISMQELQDAVSLSIPNLNCDEIHELFSLFDVDNDGSISRNDFLSCLRRYPLLVSLFAPKLLHKGLSIAAHQSFVEVF
ncbi:hypothetical protein OROGR_030005 [Orobanche gracilis]